MIQVQILNHTGCAKRKLHIFIFLQISKPLYWAETKRRELQNPLYLSSVEEDSYNFWERVWVGSNQEHGKMLRNALWFGNRKKMYEVLSQLMEEASTESRRNAIADAWKYIENQWEGIRESYIRCSAEGRISHVLSERLSSRPRGWSRAGAKHMANVRVCQANGFL